MAMLRKSSDGALPIASATSSRSRRVNRSDSVDAMIDHGRVHHVHATLRYARRQRELTAERIELVTDRKRVHDHYWAHFSAGFVLARTLRSRFTNSAFHSTNGRLKGGD
jgi:hypothetical protein